MNLGGLRERWVTAPVPDGPDLRVVVERPGHSAGTYLVALALSILFLVLFGLAVFHTVLIGAQGRLDELDAQIEAQQDRQLRLRLQLAELESPERIVDAATDDLGMVPPGEVVWLAPPDAGATSGAGETDGPGTGSSPGGSGGSEMAAPGGAGGGDR
jgi:cell division protein FtsL